MKIYYSHQKTLDHFDVKLIENKQGIFLFLSNKFQDSLSLINENGVLIVSAKYDLLGYVIITNLNIEELILEENQYIICRNGIYSVINGEATNKTTNFEVKKCSIEYDFNEFKDPSLMSRGSDILLIENNSKIVLFRNSLSKNYSDLGGHPNPFETIYETAARESYEESCALINLQPSEVKNLRLIPTYKNYNMFLYYIDYFDIDEFYRRLDLLSLEPERNKAYLEVDDVIKVSLQELKSGKIKLNMRTRLAIENLQNKDI